MASLTIALVYAGTNPVNGRHCTGRCLSHGTTLGVLNLNGHPTSQLPSPIAPESAQGAAAILAHILTLYPQAGEQHRNPRNDHDTTFIGPLLYPLSRPLQATQSRASEQTLSFTLGLLNLCGLFIMCSRAMSPSLDSATYKDRKFTGL